MVSQETLNLAAKNLTILSKEDLILRKSISIVRKRLGRLLHGSEEVQSFAEDALAETIEKLIAAFRKQTTRVTFEEMMTPVIKETADTHPLTGYLLTAVKYRCYTKYRKLTQDSESDSTRTKTRLLLDEEGGTHSDAVCPTSESLNKMDLGELKAVLLNRGFKLREFELLKLYLIDGYTYIEIANEQGGSPDKYRKIIARALVKAGLPSVKALNQSMK